MPKTSEPWLERKFVRCDRDDFHSGERLVFENLNGESTGKERNAQDAVLDQGFASTAGFPIKAKDKIIGVLHLASKAKHHFALDELRLIESITQEIGVAADNARLLNKCIRRPKSSAKRTRNWTKPTKPSQNSSRLCLMNCARRSM